MFEKYDLENKIAFWRIVRGDKKKTRETSWSRGSARDVLRVFKGGTATKTEVARELSDNSLGNVPEAEHVILPQLSGESDISPWDERPLIISEEDDWKLTAYGRLLRYLIFEHTGWESVRNIPEELVDEVQSEIEF